MFRYLPILVASLGIASNAAFAQPPMPVPSPVASAEGKDKNAAFKGDLDSEKRISPQGVDDRLTLDMVRDVGVSVRQIRELAIYIFKEATRVPLTASDPLELVGFDSISDDDFDESKKYSIVRPGWIYFYISTLEPSIQLLKDAETQKVLIPAKMKNEVSTLSARFCDCIDEALEQIKKLHQCVDDGECDNKTVANCALSIYKHRKKWKICVKTAERSCKKLRKKALKTQFCFKLLISVRAKHVRASFLR